MQSRAVATSVHPSRSETLAVYTVSDNVDLLFINTSLDQLLPHEVCVDKNTFRLRQGPLAGGTSKTGIQMKTIRPVKPRPARFASPFCRCSGSHAVRIEPTAKHRITLLKQITAMAERQPMEEPTQAPSNDGNIEDRDVVDGERWRVESGGWRVGS